MKIKLLLADDEYFIRKRILKILDSSELNFELVAEVDNGIDCIETLKKTPVHITILDIKMPRLSGLDVAKYIYENHPDTQVIILSGYSEFSYAQTAINYGVIKYLLKPVEPDKLLACLEEAKERLCEKSPSLRAAIKNEGEKLRPSDLRLVKKIRTHIEKSYLDPGLSVNGLATVLDMHPSYLNSVFKKNTDRSILNFINEKRLEHSKELLLNTDLSIKEIALRSGFNDGFYFSKKFKSKYGISPSKFRNVS